MEFPNYYNDFADDLYRINVALEIDDDDTEDEELKERLANEFYSRRCDLFEIFDNAKIYKTFRFDKDTILYIVELVKDKLSRRTDRGKPLSPLHQVLIALQFYATGSF